jgi:hypothetical protein
VKPVTQDVSFLGPLFGATIAHDGSARPPDPDGYAVGSLATVPPSRGAFADEPRPRPFLQRTAGHPRCDHEQRERHLRDREPRLGCQGGQTETWTYSPLSAAGTGLAEGSLSFADADVEAPVSSSVIRHVGACDFDAAVARTVAEAISYLQAVGCRAGRTIVHAQTVGNARSGEVYGFSLHGGQATLAPPGTVVDLLIEP